MRSEPLSQDALAALFQKNARGHLNRRESSNLELKESFNWGNRAEYAKTMAAFANARGGYIVFGVKDRPHELVGMANDAFDRLDDADLSQYLNENFSPEVRVERQVYEVGGREFGVIWVCEAPRKPVVCTRNSGSVLKESDIYYRYRAASSRIRYPELRGLLDDEAQKRHDRLLDIVIKMGQMGVENAVILDTKAGELHGANGTVIVDQDLLARVKFIEEGCFVEKDGDPTLRVIANAAPAQVVTRQKMIALRGDHVLRAFFGHGLPAGATARDALEWLPYETTSFYPVFYFAREAGLTDDQAADLIEASHAGGATKTRIGEHLRTGFGCGESGSVDKGASPQAVKRAAFLQELRDGTLDPDTVPDEDLQLALQAVTHLAYEELTARQAQVLEALEGWEARATAMGLRGAWLRAVCSVDEDLYAEE